MAPRSRRQADLSKARAYVAGANDRRDRFAFEANPYREGSVEYEAWQLGWRTADRNVAGDPEYANPNRKIRS